MTTKDDGRRTMHVENGPSYAGLLASEGTVAAGGAGLYPVTFYCSPHDGVTITFHLVVIGKLVLDFRGSYELYCYRANQVGIFPTASARQLCEFTLTSYNVQKRKGFLQVPAWCAREIQKFLEQRGPGSRGKLTIE